MSQGESGTGERLLQAISQALQVVSGDADERGALRGSFRLAVEGLGAERAFLARVGAQPETLEVIDSRGLAGHEVHAVKVGRSAPGLSVSVVQRVLSSGRSWHLEDSRTMQGVERTLAFLDTPCSVICAPVCDPQTRLPLAVLYFQTGALTRPLEAAVVPHVNAYASALGAAWGVFRRARQEAGSLREELAAARGAVESGVFEIVGRSDATEALRRLLDQVVIPAMGARHPDPILILGPTGSGKEVVARYLHRRSSRSRGPFVGLNCATFKGEILEAKLFGHVKGAFTGASADSEGVFVSANGGVLFLDEVGDMPADGQVMLLRALETRAVRPVGGRGERTVDVLLVCATNVDLERAVQRGRFRADLYHRINGLSVRVAALSERRDDVKPLVAYYLAHHERRLGRCTRGLTSEALEALERYTWPGNVRELSRACSTLILHSGEQALIDMAVVGRALPQVAACMAGRACAQEDSGSPFERDYGSFDGARAALGRQYLESVERKFRGNRTAMARYLRTSRSTLYRWLVRYGLLREGAPDVDGGETLETDTEVWDDDDRE